jgi:hypothetical protein
MALVGALVMSVALAQPDKPKMDEIIVTAGYHAIGDDGYYVVGDEPVEVYWEEVVWLKRSQIRRAKSASLEFWCWQNLNSVLWINGRKYALPYSEQVPSAVRFETGKTVISIPTGILKPGANVIAFEAGALPWSSNHYDDLMFGDVVLVLDR